MTDAVGLGAVVPAKCPHVEVQDLDNDGWPDIYTTAAWRDPDGTVTPLIYRSLGPGDDGLPHFAPPRPIGSPMVYYPTGPTADFDADGRLDLLLVNWFADDHCRLLRNESPPRHWLDVRVVGRGGNRMGLGARVRVYPAGRLGQADALLGLQEVATGYGYAGGQPAVCHFGLGDVATVDIEVRLPDGTVLSRLNVTADQSLIAGE